MVVRLMVCWVRWVGRMTDTHRHLIHTQAGELLGGSLVSLHNVFFMNRLMTAIREVRIPMLFVRTCMYVGGSSTTHTSVCT